MRLPRIAALPTLSFAENAVEALQAAITAGEIYDCIWLLEYPNGTLSYLYVVVDAEEGEEVATPEEVDGAQLFSGSVDEFNVKMQALIEQGYDIDVVDLRVEDNGSVVVAYELEIPGCPICGDDSEHPCSECIALAEAEARAETEEDKEADDALDVELDDEQCPVCGGDINNLCKACIATRAGTDEQPAAQAGCTCGDPAHHGSGIYFGNNSGTGDPTKE